MTKLTVVAFMVGIAIFSRDVARAEQLSDGQRAMNEPAPQQTLCPDQPQTEVQTVLVLLLDRSGSVQDGTQDLLPKFQTDATALIQQLPPATLVLGRYISAQSYRDTEN